MLHKPTEKQWTKCQPFAKLKELQADTQANSQTKNCKRASTSPTQKEFQNIFMIEKNDLFSVNTKTYNIADIVAINHFEKYLTKKVKEKHIEYFLIEMKGGYFMSTHEYNFFADSLDMHRLNEKIAKLSDDTGIESNKARLPHAQYTQKAIRCLNQDLCNPLPPLQIQNG